MNTFLDSGRRMGTKYFRVGRSVMALGLSSALALGASSTAWAQAGNPFGGAPAGDAPVANPFAVAGAPAAAGGAGARTVYFYAGGPAAEARVGAWGNGEATKANDIDYQSADALRVTTRNLSEGIRFDLARPVDIAPYTAPGANGLVRLRVRFASAGFGGFGGGFPGGGFPGGAPGGDPRGGFPGGGFPGGGFPGGGFPGQGGGGPKFSPALANPVAAEVGASSLPRVMGEASTEGNAQFGAPGGFPGGGFPGGDPRGGGERGEAGRGQGGQGFGGRGEGGRGEGMGFAGPPPQRTTIERFQVTMVLERGALTGGVDFNLRPGQADEAGWRLLTVPLSGMTATPGASGAVRRVILTSDKEDTWYLGEAALSVDSPEIAVSLRPPNDAPGAQVAEVTVRPGPVTLVADVEAGSSDVTVAWNFDADNAGAPMMAPVTFPGAGGRGEMGGRGERGEMGGRGERGEMGGRGMDPRGQMDPRGFPGGEGGMGFGGPRVDARGLIGKFEYPNEEQNYRVEVTVSDRGGKKQPTKSSILVKVRG